MDREIKRNTEAALSTTEGIEKIQTIAIPYARCTLRDMGLRYTEGPQDKHAITVIKKIVDKELFDLDIPLSGLFEDMLKLVAERAKEKTPDDLTFTQVFCTISKHLSMVEFSFSIVFPGLEKEERVDACES